MVSDSSGAGVSGTRQREVMTAYAPSLADCSNAFRASILGCMRCDALVRSRTQVVPGAGAIPADIAFVGLAPGRFGGDRTGIPFCGDRSGDLLRRMIEGARLDRVFVTNLVRCNPRDAGGRNRDPSRAEISNCRTYLELELAIARPRLIACLGRTAWQELAGDAPFEPRRAQPLSINGLRLVAMYHPAYVIRGAYTEAAYRRDFVRLARLLKGAD